ncbi:MAG TPA: hypothetical protein K8V82_06270 [Lachnoclostridium phocaeense]|uniref:Uncharacterized protein n=1 Tax=Lachnoclostridium phocaeense TaxID=1871021 RepID=A0A921I215_9FIRM|nr:hypothetical protein [Lachnoclostridium phocaeense]
MGVSLTNSLGAVSSGTPLASKQLLPKLNPFHQKQKNISKLLEKIMKYDKMNQKTRTDGKRTRRRKKYEPVYHSENSGKHG